MLVGCEGLEQMELKRSGMKEMMGRGDGTEVAPRLGRLQPEALEGAMCRPFQIVVVMEEGVEMK